MPNFLAIFGGGWVALTFMSLPVVAVTGLPVLAWLIGKVGGTLWGTGHKL